MTNLRVRVRSGTTGGGGGTVNIEGALYGSNGSSINPQPHLLISSGATGTTGVTNDTILDITFSSPASITRNTIYFIALRWSNVSGLGAVDFYGTNQVGVVTENSMVWRETGQISLPSSASASENADGAYWFIIYGPQTASGASAGPQGAQGATRSYKEHKELQGAQMELQGAARSTRSSWSTRS